MNRPDIVALLEEIEASIIPNSKWVAVASYIAELELELDAAIALVETGEPAGDETEVPLGRPLTRVSNLPTWEHVCVIFHRHGFKEPPVRLRDELVVVLEWAWYGYAQATRRYASPPSPVDAAKSGLFEIRDKTGEEPCGECHIQSGETCDICGASKPSPVDADAIIERCAQIVDATIEGGFSSHSMSLNMRATEIAHKIRALKSSPKQDNGQVIG